MNLGARIQAAVELLDRIETPPRGDEALPADAVLNAYFRGRRYIGAKDRRAIGDAVFQTLRQRGMIDWHLVHQAGLAATNRFRALWTFAVHGGVATEELAACCDGARHHPATLSDDEARRVLMIDANQEVAPDVADQASYPAWLAPEIERQFGADAWAQLIAFTQPAPVDLRANPLKATRDEALAALAKAGIAAGPTPLSPLGVRLEGRANVAGLAAYREGLVEVQDESSQLASLLVGAKPGMRVLDLCAGGGGKTLALAALMQNKGQIFAHDIDGRRLAPLKERLDRAGVRNVQIRAPMRTKDALADLRERMDVVFVDAPCTGSGTWRRSPDSKWRLRPNALAKRLEEQQQALALAAPLVKPGGRLVYVTCSVLPEENEDAVAAFLGAYSEFAPVGLELAGLPAYQRQIGVQMTPLKTGCDGFYVAVLQRS